MLARFQRTVYGHHEFWNLDKGLSKRNKLASIATVKATRQRRNASSQAERRRIQKFRTIYHFHAESRTYLLTFVPSLDACRRLLLINRRNIIATTNIETIVFNLYYTGNIRVFLQQWLTSLGRCIHTRTTWPSGRRWICNSPSPPSRIPQLWKLICV